MRKLASSQRIVSIREIPGADRIELAQVLGWQCVVGKGQFRPGDPVVFCEVDSLLPMGGVFDQFEFLWRACRVPQVVKDGRVQPEGYRIRTVRLQGVVSQGACFSPEAIGIDPLTPEGQDLTEVLGIIQYDAELAGKLPAYLRESEQIRLQSVPTILERLEGHEVVVTEKLDGMAFQAVRWDGEVKFCSHGIFVQSGPIWKALNQSDWSDLPEGRAVQGELMGPGICRNRLGLARVQPFLYDFWDCHESRFCPQADLQAIGKVLGIPLVPVVAEFVLAGHTVESFEDLSSRQSALSPNMAEGIVVKPTSPQRDIETGWASFKVLNPNYLLKHKL